MPTLTYGPTKTHMVGDTETKRARILLDHQDIGEAVEYPDRRHQVSLETAYNAGLKTGVLGHGATRDEALEDARNQLDLVAASFRRIHALIDVPECIATA